ncbi:MAG: hypothetical protein MJ252_11950 [archaeon]|nr:hypothetical protein [archaeon]
MNDYNYNIGSNEENEINNILDLGLNQIQNKSIGGISASKRFNEKDIISSMDINNSNIPHYEQRNTSNSKDNSKTYNNYSQNNSNYLSYDYKRNNFPNEDNNPMTYSQMRNDLQGIQNNLNTLQEKFNFPQNNSNNYRNTFNSNQNNLNYSNNISYRTPSNKTYNYSSVPDPIYNSIEENINSHLSTLRIEPGKVAGVQMNYDYSTNALSKKDDEVVSLKLELEKQRRENDMLRKHIEKIQRNLYDERQNNQLKLKEISNLTTIIKDYENLKQEYQILEQELKKSKDIRNEQKELINSMQSDVDHLRQATYDRLVQMEEDKKIQMKEEEERIMGHIKLDEELRKLTPVVMEDEDNKSKNIKRANSTTKSKAKSIKTNRSNKSLKTNKSSSSIKNKKPNS